jgi:hypothetical protein
LDIPSDIETHMSGACTKGDENRGEKGLRREKRERLIIERVEPEEAVGESQESGGIRQLHVFDNRDIREGQIR